MTKAIEAATGADTAIEHFVTLFDSGFLPMGLALHESLMKHCQSFKLWIICMDTVVEEHLASLSLPNVATVSLADMETPELLAVKSGRSRGEYCWTLTPFTFEAVFERDQSVQRVTYLDADLYFFGDPKKLLQELDAARKDVLITEHAYAPEYVQWADYSGRFCVQFLTFRRNAEAKAVMRWWQERCLEWCFARREDGKFGDQKYLDSWPSLFGDAVHIVERTEKTLAPWNVNHVSKMLNGNIEPVFYHFHEFRVIAQDRVRLNYNYRIKKDGMKLYQAYLSSISRGSAALKRHGLHVSYPRQTEPLIEILIQVLRLRCRYQRI